MCTLVCVEERRVEMGARCIQSNDSVAKTNEIDCEFGFNDLSGGVENNNSFISTGEWAAKGLPRQMQKSSNFSYAK